MCVSMCSKEWIGQELQLHNPLNSVSIRAQIHSPSSWREGMSCWVMWFKFRTSQVLRPCWTRVRGMATVPCFVIPSAQEMPGTMGVSRCMVTHTYQTLLCGLYCSEISSPHNLYAHVWILIGTYLKNQVFLWSSYSVVYFTFLIHMPL